MSDAKFYNKRKLCELELADFTDFKGIGTDPMYLRYDSVQAVVRKYLDPKYQSFLAQPDTVNGIVEWYVDEWRECPKSFASLSEAEKLRYEPIKNETIAAYRKACQSMRTDDMAILVPAIKDIADDFIYCFDGKVAAVAWGMRPDTDKRPVNGQWVKVIGYADKCAVTFDAGQHGRLETPQFKVIERVRGSVLSATDVQKVIPNEGYVFQGWSPNPYNAKVTGDLVFKAQYAAEPQPEPVPEPMPPVVEMPESEPVSPPPMVNCVFDPGQNGRLMGNGQLLKPAGSTLFPNEVPGVKPKRGYKFVGWDIDPAQAVLNGDTVFHAMYEKKAAGGCLVAPLAGIKGCLGRSCWWVLLALLLLLLLGWLLRGCGHAGCTRHVGDGYIAPVDTIVDDHGKVRDDNGSIGSVVDDDGNLPDEPVVPPMTGEDGQLPPVKEIDGMPDVVANRLNIYFEDDNPDMNGWANDFKKLYPGSGYKIIGSDPNVGMIQIQIPEDERDRIRDDLPGQMPGHNFFVVDESIITLHGHASESDAPHGWHLDAVNADKAWETAKGGKDVVIAIVDDGIDPSHPIFEDRFYKAYNVFTQQPKLSLGEGHGTHVAGLAAGSLKYRDEGAAGIAPRVKIMPVQVFDNGVCTFSSLASGIMYAIRNGADVVNVSVGPRFEGLSMLPEDQQREIASSFFKNEEKVYRRIFDVAKKKNVILVFAAGNDTILASILPECRSDQTINVAAVNQELKATDFTNKLDGANISAPGEGIYSSFNGGGFQTMDGTSMAAPMVAGAVALMRSIKPDLTAAQALGVLQKTGKRSADRPEVVPPVIQIDKALQAVRDGDIPDGPVWHRRDGGVDAPAAPVVTAPQNPGNPANEAKPGSDYDQLRRLLENLKKQRDDLNSQIEQIESEMGNGK